MRESEGLEASETMRSHDSGVRWWWPTGCALAVLFVMLAPTQAATTWTAEKVGRGLTSSIAVDRGGNLHLAFVAGDNKVYYAFRPATSDKWYTVRIIDSTHYSRNIFPRVAVGHDNRPQLCVAFGVLDYITLSDHKWVTQEIDPGSGTISYHCSIAVDSENNPHVSWYHEFLPSGQQFSHFRHAQLEDGVWMVRSVDGGVSGKWNSMTIDSKGFPHLSYSQWASGGDLRYAEWDGKRWAIADVDSSHNTSTARGYDNSLALGTDGSAHISYIDDTKIKYAHQDKGKWIVETVSGVSAGYDHYAGSTTMLLDQEGAPHIIFGDFGGIKHVFRNGDKWETETIISGAVQQYAAVDAAIGADGTLYVSYPDPDDGYVKVVSGKLAELAATRASEEKEAAEQATPKQP